MLITNLIYHDFRKLLMIRQSIQALRANKFIIKYAVVMIIIANGIPAILSYDNPNLKNSDTTAFMIPYVQKCHVMQYPQRENYNVIDNKTVSYTGDFSPTREPLKWWINCLSYKTTGSFKLIPVLFNIGLMPLVYLLTLELSKDRLVSLISLIAFTNNPLYHDWIGSGTYDQVWSFFLILSVYLIFKSKEAIASPFTIIISTAAKILTLMYLPAFFYTIKQSKLSRREKIILPLACIGAVLLVGAFVLEHTKGDLIGSAIGFYPQNWHDAAYHNWEMLWPEIPFLMIFTLLSVNFVPVHPSPWRKLCAIWILNALITTPIISLFTNQIQFVYRFVPLAVFMSIFISITINDIGKFVLDYKINRLPKKL